MKFKPYNLLLGVFLLMILPMPAAHKYSISYTNPLPGSLYNNPGTTITVRFGETLTDPVAQSIPFLVIGSVSGSHPATVVLADDDETVIYKPDQPFAYGEQVTVDIDQGSSFTFSTSSHKTTLPQNFSFFDPDEAGFQSTTPAQAQKYVPSSSPTNPYVTVPSDFPNIQVSVPANQTADGDLFFNNMNLGPTSKSPYLIIADNSGQPVYFQKISAQYATDFKVLPSGNLSYWDAYTTYFYILDNAYHLVDVIKPGNGYINADPHELLLLPNGHYLFLVEDDQTIDMSAYAGSSQALVLGLTIQELDSKKNVVFQWRSFDHFSFTDSYIDLTTPTVDYVHSNAIELDKDENILLSSRHLAEITKINHQTGAIIWRLGGKNNQFNFTNDKGFYFQHDIRRQLNGNITLFDNNNNGTFSRGVEYSIDEVGKTITKVVEYRNNPDTYSPFMGDTQRLPNGNTLIGWGGGSSPLLTEFKPDGSKAFELTMDAPSVSYRAFRFSWHGYPTWAPALVLQQNAGVSTLYFSWNGATEIASYRVYGGFTPLPTTLLSEVPKTSFETSLNLQGAQTYYCYFRVMPVDNLGRVTTYSDTIINPGCGAKTYVPFLTIN